LAIANCEDSLPKTEEVPNCLYEFKKK